jgi:hypothetical protein
MVPKGASLALRTVAVRSCFRFGLIAGGAVALVAFVVAFVTWQIVTPGVESAVAAAFAGSQSLLHGILGAGTGAAVSAALALLAGVVVTVASVLTPLFYDLAARRTGGVGLVLAPE